jgi:hypothetical protein
MAVQETNSTEQFSLSRFQVATMAGCSPNHIFNEIKRGHLQAFFIGSGKRKKIRILKVDAIAWITRLPVKSEG